MSEEDKKLLLEMKSNCLEDRGTSRITYNDEKRIKKAKAIDNALKEIERLNNIINELEKYIGSKMNSFGICNSSDIYYKLQELKGEELDDVRPYDELDEILELERDNLSSMKQYPIERDVFCEIFGKIDSDFYDELYDITTESFKCWRYDDNFYILHFESGTLINWYKHLGRCNTCNKDLSIDEYKYLAKLLYNELKKEIK